ncbi:MAG: hypothetical protein J4F40_18635 [Alphaproteobacteria bacterium]|nr:hypothetical protein [Alphaproteobacteria bacterium]
MTLDTTVQLFAPWWVFPAIAAFYALATSILAYKMSGSPSIGLTIGSVVLFASSGLGMLTPILAIPFGALMLLSAYLLAKHSQSEEREEGGVRP